MATMDTLASMDSQTTLKLFEEGGIFLFEAVPPGTQVGIDMESWTTGDKFKGIKMIPPGMHFIHFSTVSRDGHSQSPRLGFFHNFKRAEIVCRKYDPVTEDLVQDDSRSAEEKENELTRIRLNLKELDKSLGPYPYSTWRKWISLSSKITESLSLRLCPASGRICSAPELSLDEDQESVPLAESSNRRHMTKLEIAESLLPRMSETEGSKIRYTQIPPPLYDASAPAAEITRQNLDWSLKLEVMIQLCGNPAELLGELEFTFVCFLVGQNYTSFQHWKNLIQLICYSQAAILKYPNMYIDFLSDLYFELMEVQADLFTDIVTQNNLIFACLKRLFSNIRDCEGVEGRLLSKAGRFQNFLSSKFGWIFSEVDDEDEEDMPVVVNENGEY